MFSESADLYDAIYAGFKDYAKEASQVAALLRRLHPACVSVLDVGCGTGEHARLLAAGHGFRVDGLDLDPRFVDIAARKCPASRFHQADMAAFDLPERYDAVICLFSSIGYARTLDRVGRALACFRRHLAPDGIVLVEPWFAPGVLEPDRVATTTVQAGDLRIERVGRVTIEGRLSRIQFEYHLQDGAGRRTATEVHELGLFTRDEMIEAFSSAGLAVQHDPVGLDGRGLYIARAAHEGGP